MTADDILVLQNIGPKGAPGMPEAGYLPIPKKLARAGVKDMVRISDARMSGTAFGTIVLDFECVIVDDASTDDSAEVVQRTLDELADRRLADPPAQERRPDRRHAAGLAATRATFVCFLDSDDLWNPDFLERHLAAHLNESPMPWDSPPAMRG